MALGYTPRSVWLSADGDGGAAGPLKTANTAKDGTGTVNTLVTGAAGATRVVRINFRAAGTNIPTLARIFLNNGSTNATAANNILWKEYPLPQTTSNETQPNPEVSLAGPGELPSGYKVLITLATTVATGWYVSGEMNDF